MIGVVLFSVICLLLLFLKWLINEKRLKAMNLPPMYPGPIPFIGHAHLLVGNTTFLWTQVKKLTAETLRQGGVLSGLVGSQVYYMIADPDDCLTAANACLQKHFAYDFGKPWMGEGLVVASGPVWKRHRKLLSPAFSLQVLHSFLGVFNSQSRKLLDSFSPDVGKGPFNHLTQLKDVALETVCKSAFGISPEEDPEFNQAYMKAVDQILNILALRFQNCWYHSEFIFKFSALKRRQDKVIKVLNSMSDAVIKKKRAALKTADSDAIAYTSGIKCKALMDLMIDLSQENSFSDKEIREEVDTAIVAAYDTTSCLMAYILMFLGNYPDKQDAIYKELMEVFGESDRDVEKDDLPKLVYTDAVIKETLRLLTMGPVGLRYVENDVKLKNYTMRAGTYCALLNYGVHRHPMWGPDVEEFKPERWLSPETLPPGPAIFAGFSIGKRSCMGRTFATLSMKTMLSHVLRRYKVTHGDVSKLVLKIDFLLKPVSGHEISLEERERHGNTFRSIGAQ